MGIFFRSRPASFCSDALSDSDDIRWVYHRALGNPAILAVCSCSPFAFLWYPRKGDVKVCILFRSAYMSHDLQGCCLTSADPFLQCSWSRWLVVSMQIERTLASPPHSSFEFRKYRTRALKKSPETFPPIRTPELNENKRDRGKRGIEVCPPVRQKMNYPPKKNIF